MNKKLFIFFYFCNIIYQAHRFLGLKFTCDFGLKKGKNTKNDIFLKKSKKIVDTKKPMCYY